MFGNPETTTGGRALKFYSSIRVDIRRIAATKDGDVVVGNRTKVKVVKNKVASPFREAELISSTARASRRKAISLIWAWRRTLSKRAAGFSHAKSRAFLTLPAGARSLWPSGDCRNHPPAARTDCCVRLLPIAEAGFLDGHS
jgi:hypothetical protein